MGKEGFSALLDEMAAKELIGLGDVPCGVLFKFELESKHLI